jgi:predicted secreted protein
MGLRLGLEAKLYRNTGTLGSASPTLNPIDNCRDLTITLEKNEADVTTRGANGWRQLVGVLKDATIEFSMIKDGADADYVAIRDAFYAASAPATQLDIFVMSADVDESDSEGIRAVCIVTGLTDNQPLEEAQTVDVTLRPTYFPAMPPAVVTGTTYGAYD